MKSEKQLARVGSYWLSDAANATPIKTPILEVDWDRVIRLRPSTMQTTKLSPYVLLPEAVRIIDSAKDTPTRMFYILLWITGARLSEIHYLMKENFHLHHPDLPHITLPTLKQKKGDSIVQELRLKKKRSAVRAKIRKLPHRMIGVSDSGYLGELDRYLADLGGPPSTFLFKPETTHSYWGWLKRDVKQLNLDINVSPKAFRHGFGVSATLQGIPADGVQDLMGLSTIEHTAIYTSILKGHYAFMVERMRFS